MCGFCFYNANFQIQTIFFCSTYAQRYMISFHDKNCKDGSMNPSNYFRTKEPMNGLAYIVATSVSQILWHNKCAKMNHGLMIHDYCLFYNATTVDALLYSTEITTFRTSIVAAEIYIFQNILLFTFLSTLCAETYSNCNSVQMFMNLGFDFWQKRKIELFILLTFSIVKKDLTISTK